MRWHLGQHIIENGHMHISTRVYTTHKTHTYARMQHYTTLMTPSYRTRKDVVLFKAPQNDRVRLKHEEWMKHFLNKQHGNRRHDEDDGVLTVARNILGLRRTEARQADTRSLRYQQHLWIT